MADMPRASHFNPGVDIGADYRSGWSEAPDMGPSPNPYRVGWEDFLRHVVADRPLRADFAAGIRDVQLAEACYRSTAAGTLGEPRRGSRWQERAYRLNRPVHSARIFFSSSVDRPRQSTGISFRLSMGGA